MTKCDSCRKREAKHRSLGGIELCHPCAHDMGLGHKHPDIEDTMHVVKLEGEKLQEHLAEYRDEEAEV